MDDRIRPNLYRVRFPDEEGRKKKVGVWKVIIEELLRKYIPSDATVLEIGAGYCEFINNIACSKKIVVDLNTDTPKHADPDVEVHTADSTEMSFIPDDSADVVFMSNFLHCIGPKSMVTKTLQESFRILKKGGRVIIIQPNYKAVPRDYWDFYDHEVALSDKSMGEVLEMVGFSMERAVPRLFPFTTKSRIPQHPFLVRMYLRMPFVWPLMGAQMFFVAVK